ncbi:MAG: hypothetical protein JO327_07200 [Nitrososphaeraceae archaeon]|nr:hypothetical protein [Nitrososphaeraceae archaeon]
MNFCRNGRKRASSGGDAEPGTNKSGIDPDEEGNSTAIIKHKIPKENTGLIKRVIVTISVIIIKQ